MLRLATFGIRPLQVGMTRHPVSTKEEVEDLLLGTPLPGNDVVARFYVGEVDEMEAAQGEHNPLSGFQSSNVFTRPLLGVAFTHPHHLPS